MRIVIATVKVPFVFGGAELHAEGLSLALKNAGHEVETFALPFKWYPPERILDHMLAVRLLDLSESEGKRIDLLIGLKFPAYLAQHPNKVLWILHQHRQAYDLWDDPIGSDLIHFPNGTRIREAIINADRELIGQSKKVFANSKNVAERLRRAIGLTAEPLYHPPPNADKFYHAEAEPYFFFPSRILSTKRQELVLQALERSRNPVRVKFAGTPNNPDYFRQLRSSYSKLEAQGRVDWLGAITEESKRELYAKCEAVIYPPLDEDYGYVTLEAMLSGKPVVTCSDSGGPLEFIESGQNGIVAEPSAKPLAGAMDELWADKPRAARLGNSALESYKARNISWNHVVEKLLVTPSHGRTGSKI